jgi:hypothetical protein
MKNYNITCYADLEREEKRVRMRIRKQEEEILVRVKKLPEEIVVSAITKVISSIINGDAVKSGMSVFRSIRSYFGNKENEPGSNSESKNTSFKSIALDIIKKVFNKNFSAD